MKGLVLVEHLDLLSWLHWPHVFCSLHQLVLDTLACINAFRERGTPAPSDR